MAIKQEGSVEEYQEAFEALSATQPHLVEEVLESDYLNGLNPILRAEVLASKPTGLDQIMRRAQLIEDQATTSQENGEVNQERPSKGGMGGVKLAIKTPETTATRSVTLASKPGTAVTAPAVVPTVKKETAYKRLTEEEYRKRWENGLCFRCEKKYSVGHRCRNQQLRVFMVHDEELTMTEEEEDHEEGETLDEKGKAVVLNTVVGLTTLGMIKIKGILQGQGVVVLLDCGAAHNFISNRLVKEFKIPQSETYNYGIIAGTRPAVKGKGICCGVVMELLGVTVVEDFLLIELNDLDVILGMKCLQAMGKMEIDWPALTITFTRGTKGLCLRVIHL
ncbi:uncharacterized protein LOC111004816 [Momordica charantia]|uniref:Uncharacterized protein LOC111004816 n=1 Tax=Momordica charantia TaxID=3673 RepID=A0A6J1BU87_MOMCH|nr:uncharacterized protein LOC111004816 [Momordica charantia]